MVGFKIDPKLKSLLQRLAGEENRTLSNFIINALLTYVKEHKGIDDWRKDKVK